MKQDLCQLQVKEEICDTLPVSLPNTEGIASSHWVGIHTYIFSVSMLDLENSYFSLFHVTSILTPTCTVSVSEFGFWSRSSGYLTWF